MKIVLIIATILLSCSLGFSQETAIPQYSDAIEDNSYFIEEAYNQEEGVVQHISNGVYFSTPQSDFVYSFTQEWPLCGQTHQLSVTVPYAFLNSNLYNGFGDIYLNYRYQLSTSEAGIASSPRLSLIIPSGDETKGLGSGVLGVQFNLPLSKRMSEEFITHYNIGATILPGVEGMNASGQTVEKTLVSYNIGASIIWLADKQYNFMFEAVDNIISDFDANGDVATSNEFILSPGFRYAIDVNSLQIVPGIAVPIKMSENSTDVGTFFYLSFEHPF